MQQRATAKGRVQFRGGNSVRSLYLAYSTSLYLIYTSQMLKQRINKLFYRFDEIKVPLPLDDTSPRCTYTAKDTTEYVML